MNADREILLAAYLDDELDAEGREAAETLLRTDPSASEFLASQGRVRDLVGGMARPESMPDVSHAVVMALGVRRRTRRAHVVAMASLASSLAAAALLLLIAPRIQPPARSVPPSEPPKVEKATPIAPRALPIATRPRPASTVAPSGSAVREEVLAAETRARDERVALKSLMGGGDVRRVDVVVDQLDPSHLNAMDAVVASTQRLHPQFARVRVVQSVEMDPELPGRACVYVLVMDGHEYTQFRQNLDARFDDASPEPVTVPRDAAQAFASLGAIEYVKKGEAAGTLKPPPIDAREGAIASRAPKREGIGQAVFDAHGNPIRREGVPASRNAPARPKRPKLPEELEPTVSRVYVVWMTQRERPRG